MEKIFRCLKVFLVLWAIPLGAATTYIYVTNNADTTISVIDAATNKVVQAIDDIEVSHAIDFSPDGSRLYITQEYEGIIRVLDRKTTKTIKIVPLSGRPNLLVVTPDGKRILVAIAENPPKAAVDIVDTTSLRVVKTIPMKGWMHDIYVTKDGKYAIAGSQGDHSVVVIDLQTDQPVWEVKLDNEVLTIAIESNPDGSARRLFVQLLHLNGFVVVDFAKRREVDRIIFPEDFPQFTPPASHGSGITPDGKTYIVLSVSGNSAFFYSLPELKLIGRVALPEVKLEGRPNMGAGPSWLTFSPDGQKVYISNRWTKPCTVSVIDVKNLKEVARIPVGERPQRMATLVVP